ncbi:MAG: cytochrome bc complex cytochrome b subunit [Marmoricola sp.]
MSAPRSPAAAKAATWADERLGIATMAKKQIRKVFPDHWSFMLGEIALWSFVILLLTGVFLTLWYTPSMSEVTYTGSYEALRGLKMSQAYASTLHLSFDVRAGLLMRQMHHWAAMLFVASMLVHMARVFVTGAYRKPRELNWIIGGALLLLGIIEGFAGYSLPDDLLSGSGLRIADGLVKATPVVGTYISFFMFGGEFPGDQIISRLYIAHVLLLPGLLLALIAAHMLLLVHHKHTQFPGPGKTESNVVGYPLLPVYAAKAGGFFFIVFGVTALLGGLATINPVWGYGPYDPAEGLSGSQPDWYMGVPDGLLRIFPGWESHIFGHTISWSVLLPGAILPVVLLVSFLSFPFVEAWVTGDKREHHLLDRPRNAPTRTAFLAASMTVYGVLWATSGNDIVAYIFRANLNALTLGARVAVFVLPVVVFRVTKRICIGLQRKDREVLEHGRETGIIVRTPSGGYYEKHTPASPEQAYLLASRPTLPVVERSYDEDANGVPNPNARRDRVRVRLARAWVSGSEDLDEPQPPRLGSADE